VFHAVMVATECMQDGVAGCTASNARNQVIEVAVLGEATAPWKVALIIANANPPFQVGWRSIHGAVEVENGARDRVRQQPEKRWCVGSQSAGGVGIDGPVAVKNAGLVPAKQGDHGNRKSEAAKR